MTKEERETIIRWDEASDECEIYSCYTGVWTRCEKLGLKPCDVQTKNGIVISKTYKCTKKHVSIRKPYVMPEEQRARASELCKKYGFKKGRRNA